MRSLTRPIAAALVATIVSSTPVQANVSLEQMINSRELYQVEATAYCNPNGNLTATGRPTTEGLTVATCKEWLGCTLYVWTINEDGTYEFYGIFEAMDTGSDKRLQNGSAIDIYMDSYDDCIQWGRRKVMVQIVRSVG